MKKSATFFLLFCMLPFTAFGNGLPWDDHAQPFDFFFENRIDTHQQSKTLGNSHLKGFLYVIFEESSNQTLENSRIFPVARHGNCEVEQENCTAGWNFEAVPAQATFLGRRGGTPMWCLDADALPNAPGYSHFHWTGAPETGAGLIFGETHAGYLMKLIAIDTFVFLHQGGQHDPVLVTPGIDLNSHANILTDCIR